MLFIQLQLQLHYVALSFAAALCCPFGVDALLSICFLKRFAVHSIAAAFIVRLVEAVYCLFTVRLIGRFFWRRMAIPGFALTTFWRLSAPLLSRSNNSTTAPL